MKKTFLALFLTIISLNLFSQITYFQDNDKKSSITIGILQGGGSLVGADFETLLEKNVGVQFGAGFVGYGGGIDFHLKPTIRSSFFSLQYWHQGFGNSYTQSLIGPTFVYRSRSWFTAQIGLGYVLGYGSAYPSSATKVPFILMYSIGAYFPI